MRSIYHCVDEKINQIYQEVEKLNQLTAELKKHISKPLVDQCQVVGFQRNNLLIQVRDATWALELRYLIPDLYSKLRKEPKLHSLGVIKILIQEDFNIISNNSSSSKLNISKTSRQLIYQAAKTCNYEPLQKALYKLSRINQL